MENGKVANPANPELTTTHIQEEVSKAKINVVKSKFHLSQWQIHDRILVIPHVMLSKTLFSF